MAELTSREISEPVTTTTTASPIEQLVQQSTVSYSPPPELSPTMSTTVAKVLAANSTPISSKPITTQASVVPQTMTTRPLLIGNLMIDPVTGTSTLMDTGAASAALAGGGGGGGSASGAKSTGTATQKKSWFPVLLIGTGLLIIGSKFLSKKTKKA